MQETKLETVIVSKADRVATITLNRPDKSNAFSRELVRDIGAAVRQVAGDSEVNAVIITGAGRSFSAGGDVERNVSKLPQMSPAEFDAFYQELEDMFFGIAEMEKPVIAAVNGPAIAGGMELALTCDIRIASEAAKFGVMFVRMSLAPEVCFHYLPRLVGLGMAKFMSLTGDLIDARQAKEMGLVEMVVPPDNVMPAALELAARLSKGPKAVGLIKRAYNETVNMDFRSSMIHAKRLMYGLVHTEDFAEAVKAYFEKRPAVFKNR